MEQPIRKITLIESDLEHPELSSEIKKGLKLEIFEVEIADSEMNIQQQAARLCGSRRRCIALVKTE